MKIETENNNKSKKMSNNNHNNNNNVNKEQLAQIKSNLLNPNEVTFCNLSDGSCNSLSSARRKKFHNSTNETDADSIISSINPPTKKKYKIPDGGYGWVVVFASFVVSMIADGVSFSFGLLYTEFLIYFKESPTKTSWIGSLFLAVPLMSGPIMSNLVDTYGCRRMTIIGGFFAGLGFVLSTFCHSIEMLYLTFGVIAGLGLGIGYVTAVVSIAFWFDKKRTFATGIGASGTGIGTFIYAPFTQALIDHFGWRGAVLILAGTIFNMCVMGALMRDPEWLIEENRLESRSQSVQTFSNSSVCLDEIKKLLETGARHEDVLDTLVTNYNTEANQQISVPENIELAKKYQSEMLLPTYLRDDLKILNNTDPHCGSWRSLRPNKKSNEYNLEKEQILSPTRTLNSENEKILAIKRHLASSETLNPSEKESFYDGDTITNVSLNSNSNSVEDLYRRFSLDETLFKTCPESPMHLDMKQNRGISLDAIDEMEPIAMPVPKIETSVNHRRKNKKKHKVELVDDGNLKRNLSLRNSHYFRNMRIHRNSINYRGAMLNTHRYRLRASSCPNIYRNSMTTIAREEEEKWYDNFIDIIKSAFDFSLFKEIKFFMFNLSTLFLFIWFIVPYFYIPDHLLQYDYTEEDSAKLISCIGIFQTIGMVALGWVGDRPWCHVSKLYGVCLVFCGISVALMPLATSNYPMLIGLSIIFGITFASSFSFTPIILVRLVDLEDFTVSYGLVLLVQGVGNLIGPPLSSSFYDLTGRWDEAFYVGGFFIVVSGILAYITGILEDREKLKETLGGNNKDTESASSL